LVGQGLREVADRWFLVKKEERRVESEIGRQHVTAAHSSQENIVQLLKRRGGGLSVKQLCSLLKLSPMAVRRQLSALEAKGLIFSITEKGRMGRPALLYYLTEDGHESFPKDYATLANDLLVSVRARDGKDKIRKLLEHRNRTLLDQAQEKLTGKTLGSRVQAAARFLTQQGYMATWETSSSKCYLIKLMNCAVEKVARKFPQLCLCEEEFLSQLLDAPVTRRDHILRQDQFCSYLVKDNGQSD
jgi:predicted ArsR family transcriptional regulator